MDRELAGGALVQGANAEASFNHLTGSASMNNSIINTVIIQQQKRIADLEKELMDSRAEVKKIRSSMKEKSGTMSVASADSGVGGGAVSSIGTKRKHRTSSRFSDAVGNPRYWTADEHSNFLVACEKFGSRNYVAISQFVGTRTPKQVRTHVQKYEVRLIRESNGKLPSIGNEPSAERDKSNVEKEPAKRVAMEKASVGSSVSFESEKREDSLVHDRVFLSEHEGDADSICMEMLEGDTLTGKVKGLSDVEFLEEWFVDGDGSKVESS
uniref:HTH myb-type domain-containing protein n=1 Tax=Rhodosorus marinus TaxID=101924 RepID=A0A7S0BTN9_9RHOD|mmetsp:Transcript_9009/g.13133  ORF Transcript_9009/g.13133 Transcript_9009/m.13133 type:complete len:268 (+) Transcript_9009:363-1166(+)